MAHDTTGGAFPRSGHDHSGCLAEAVARAERQFAERGLKLTEQRRLVLAEIAASHNALGAYEILDRLAARGRRLAPISVYRALDALAEVGAIHRLESRNAFFACHSHHASRHEQLVLACEQCGRVAELAAPDAFAALTRATAAARFKPRRSVVEIVGTCAECHKGAVGTGSAP
ncbi:MAG: Fur family transcriptional regulator [Hyphomicrobiaceae bacterium]